jgi:hypothetical protein
VRVSTQFVLICFCEDGYDPSRILKFKKFIDQLRDSHLKRVHGVARPQVSDGEYGLQICRVAANALN